MTDMQQRIVGYGKRKERLPQGLKPTLIRLRLRRG